MATIEPRLIHLLNDSSTPHLGHVDLPPPVTVAAAAAAATTATTTTAAATAPASSSRSSLVSSAIALLSSSSSSSSSPPSDVLGTLPPLLHDVGGHRTDCTVLKNASGGLGASLYSDEGLGIVNLNGCLTGAGAYKLRLPATHNGSISDQASNYLSKILDDYCPDVGVAVSEDVATKKRRAITIRDDLVQLPQPVKKQKALSQVMPPIINGLLEPPHQESLLPPMSEDGLQLKMVREFPPAQHPDFYAQTDADKDKTPLMLLRSRKRSSKPRRKWSEEETRHLLLGVNKHGVGRWSLILEDSEFSFNHRSAGDLKDRFRTCCPDELRRKRSPSDDSPSTPTSDTLPRLKMAGILTDSPMHGEVLGENGNPTVQAPPTPQDVDFSIFDGPPAKLRKTRAHRKNMEDLAELGIHGPFKKSHRRERRPFTDLDDRNILEGLELYGPAWTKIQRDGRFNLTTRQPTDLRDRVRNKHPDVYARIERGWWAQNKDGATGTRTDVMEPSVNMFIDTMVHKPTTTEHQLSRTGSKDDISKWPHGLLDAADSPASGHAFDFVTEPAVAPSGDMDISRLLLDDSQLSHGSK